MGRHREYDVDQVIDAALHAFWARGFGATSISDLVDVTGVNRASLYSVFKDKRGLFLACLHRYEERQREGTLARLAREMEPREAILATFEIARVRTSDCGIAGCFMINTALELSPHDPDIRDIVQQSFGRVEAFYCEQISAAQAAGTISAELDPGRTAEALLGLLIGLRVLMRSGAEGDAAPASITLQARMLLDHGPDRSLPRSSEMN
ncbi:HTH-type transcriptional repressor ComR [Roseovarius sp. A-2]|uniref:TetR/AcrR family transcriptional regulator n=1 Tax=Roseovarius sp. A-2 TaxID=1570360 RepID=UPI0009B504D6|nr:TetR/AcrR family transcriptional regulator [Roseovarius sp. A-2]GAW33280.1 HTH-type transcriptional repressor ComR [Roseovarius sp. A-2]